MNQLNKYKIKVLFCTLLVLCSFWVETPAYAQNQFTNSFNFESSKLPYNWHTSSWSQCLGECNEGNQSRTVFCKDNSGNDAPSEANCSHTPKPEILRTCDLPDCQWVSQTCAPHSHWTVETVSNSASDDGNFRGIDADGNHVCNGPDC